MSIIPARYDFKDHYRGSTFASIPLKFNFDLTGATIVCQIKPQVGAPFIHEWRTGTNITVNNLLTGDIILQKINDFAPQARSYVYDLEIDFPNGENETYMTGKLTVIQDITTP